MHHRVTYYFPGSLFSEESTRTIDHRDPARAADDAPDGAFCFTLHDVEETPDLGPDFTVIPKPKNKTGRYYIGGEVFTVEQVEALDGDHDILAANMRCNGYEQVVRCRTGNWQPLEADDVVLEIAPR